VSKRSAIDDVVALLKEVGATTRVVYGKHWKVYWALDGQRRITVVQGTASDHRSHKNALAFVRRQLREIGHAV
jgi:hypothetical protein